MSVIQRCRSLFDSPENYPFCVRYLAPDQAEALLNNDKVITALHFGTSSCHHPQDPRQFNVGLKPLDAPKTVEVWTSQERVIVEKLNHFTICRTPSFLFAYLILDETQFPCLEETTAHAYRQILGLIRHYGYPHLLRIWHYFPEIHLNEQGLERYQAFCLGRYRVLESNAGFERTLPAATAIGTQGTGFLIYFLAATSAGVQIENPRQVSAFRYPYQYSPKSPSFSRALLKYWNSKVHLYVSGTASIVGHESRHENVSQQLQEILDNFTALICHINQLHQLKIRCITDFAVLKVYIRFPEDFMTVKTVLEQVVGNKVPILFLQGDICRRNLLVEIEGMI